MADYKELLRRAVEALPENHGAARRAVYEKARAALVGQLRAIDPPLPARDITSHRLQLEDCIREVEREASEAVNGRRFEQPVPAEPELEAGLDAEAEAAAVAEPVADVEPEAGSEAEAESEPALPAGETKPTEDAVAAEPAGGSIEDIIAAAHADGATDVAPEEPVADSTALATAMPLATPVAAEDAGTETEATAEAEPDTGPDTAAEAEPDTEAADDAAPVVEPEEPVAAERPKPSIVAGTETSKSRSLSTAFGFTHERSNDGGKRVMPRFEPAAHGGQAALARHEQPEVATAMSAVREVEVEAASPDPQSDIDRAIATLDREARGDAQAAANDAAAVIDDEDEPAFSNNSAPEALFKRDETNVGPAAAERRTKPPKRQERRETALSDAGFPRARPEDDRGGMSALTIFLIVLAVLLLGAGGAGYWAVSQGYLDLGSMFRSSDTATNAATTTPEAPATDPTEAATGPGNTATPVTPPPATELEVDDRLVPDPALTGDAPLALLPSTDGGKSEARLGDTEVDSAANAEAAVAALDPASAAGSQSLLLEDSGAADTGAVPFSGTVDWSKGTDETGLPTLIAKANIPARNLGVDILIRKNQDPALPASHLMEINFSLSDGFIGGSIAGLPGVLLKNEELVQGTPLVGPSGVRVVANSFLFALSASPEDAVTNTELLTTRKWMDLFVIYATGKRAILTLEKDEEAEALFAEVFDAWGDVAAVEPAATELPE